MNSRLIKRQFVYSPASDILPPVTLDYSWSSFMNTYAVWPANSGDSVTIRRNIVLQAGYYYVTGAVDNYGSVTVNGQYISLYNFNANIDRGSKGNSTRIYHVGGLMTIVISATNTGGPRGVAVTISEQIARLVPGGFVDETETGRAITGYEYSVGNLVWSTRSPGVVDIGRYQVTMPFDATITAQAWGGGGGGGGMDAGTQGGLGAPGLYNTKTFNVFKGDILEVFVGEGGNGGGSNSGSAPGGSAGLSRINLNGDSAKSFNGGAGSAAGPKPYSGGGGGGGGASGVLVNNVPILVAAGGGGGGGAGNDGNGSSQYARRDATITNNANGASGTDFRGENGQSKGGDGGGAGGGGGGYPGGQGGAVFGGDASGFAGQCGGNFPIRTPLPGEVVSLNNITYSLGGARGGGDGRPGVVLLEIEPVLSKLSLKVSGTWKQVDEAFVKFGGTWKEIDKVYLKINNSWKLVGNVGQQDLSLSSNTQSYGTSTRSFS